jgi:cyclophilin family peptidyl-prolyl cis-trans isomerase
MNRASLADSLCSDYNSEMGINPDWLEIFMDLFRRGSLKPGDALLDIGASELFCSEEPQRLNEFLACVGGIPYNDTELHKMAHRAFAASLFERAGFPYAAIDYANFPGIIRLDLNFEELPGTHHRRYQYVFNCGTSEHILNQLNVFRVIHDATADGGLMYHGVPGWGDYEHGIFGYSPKFFWELATANDYEIVRFWGSSDGNPAMLKPEFMKQITFSKAPVAEKVWLHILLKKRSERPFKVLNDPSFSPEFSAPR